MLRCGLPPMLPGRALAMASSIPADLIGAPAGRLRPGAPADLVHFASDWTLSRVWQSGRSPH
ncbi:MAG: hypothetical protein EAZ89_02870 [Bacteroidetes bacterium]|nr:MAG: hypothetical protein EAZ89_02870 [Bacteroidota bacterium]